MPPPRPGGGASRAGLVTTARAKVIAASSYSPTDRHVLFELVVDGGQCNGYGDVPLSAKRRWSAGA
jgi:hypothetical protein